MTNRPTTRPVRTADAAAWISDEACRASAAFGLLPSPTPNGRTPIDPYAAALSALSRPGVVLLTGPSGSGKSRRIEGVRRAFPRRRILDATAPDDPSLGAFDLLGVAHDRAVHALAAAGLAEPALWLRPAPWLSVGERSRLALAVAIARARPGDLVICDEFASCLDRATAQALGAAASRWAARAGVTLLAATAHADAGRFLTTTATVHAPSGSLGPGRERDRPALRIESGDAADLDALAHHHYRPGRPAAVVRVLRCVRTTPEGEHVLAGVLGVSMPVLNASWRPLAWPGRFESTDRRANARRLNHEVRCIARVIVTPGSRGLGIASMLVRAYLDDPLTPRTEAAAAMGACCLFFRAAGMREYRLPRLPHDARLADALDAEGLRPTDLIRPADRSAFIARELDRWARHARVRIDPARHAACRLLTEPRAYAHTHGATP
ncbi:MAG: hypothetical protein LAT64_04770 [Phycisphaerales bacterium]|nr:hypothetical protein [Planctomycetota bacterium]MCH8508067.1 hypothetical protein [Phycisphaerales bacterium]